VTHLGDGWRQALIALEGIVNLTGDGTRSTERQCCASAHAAIWAQVSCRQTRKALARARRYSLAGGHQVPARTEMAIDHAMR